MKINMLFMLRAALLIWTFTSLFIVLRDVRKHKDEINFVSKWQNHLKMKQCRVHLTWEILFRWQ